MKTRFIRADEGLREAGEIIRNGGLVAFPTETVYGLGANAFDADAAAKIYAAKDRPSDNPLIVHICEKEQIYGVADEVGETAKRLMERFWPGPLTLILKKKDTVPDGTTGGLDTVAVRLPSHPVARELIREAGVPIAAPSANRSGRPSPTCAEHVMEDMDGRIDMVIDGGEVGIGIESTIIDLTQGEPMILRPGFITQKELTETIGEVGCDRVVNAKSAGELAGGYRPKAPGMKYRHYAPKAELTIYEGDEEKVVEKINEMCIYAKRQGLKAGVICTDETLNRYGSCVKVSVGSRSDENEIARNLYGALRYFDSTDTDVIYGETFYGDEFGSAIMNRMIKAAGYRLERL